MTLGEFITFCTLKGIVNKHLQIKLKAAKVEPNFSVHRIELQARGYDVYIRYENDDGKLSIAHTTLYDRRKPTTMYEENVSLSLIQEKLLDL